MYSFSSGLRFFCVQGFVYSIFDSLYSIELIPPCSTDLFTPADKHQNTVRVHTPGIVRSHKRSYRYVLLVSDSLLWTSFFAVANL